MIIFHKISEFKVVMTNYSLIITIISKIYTFLSFCCIIIYHVLVGACYLGYVIVYYSYYYPYHTLIFFYISLFGIIVLYCLINKDIQQKIIWFTKYVTQITTSSDAKILYHQTSAENAIKILASQKMYRGNVGLAGGGIYFTDDPNLTNHKAKNKGVILRCNVILGKIKTLGPTGDPNICYTSLRKQGFNSCLIKRANGYEYVVYNHSQVRKITIH